MASNGKYLAALVSSILLFQCIQLVASAPFDAIEHVFYSMENCTTGVQPESNLSMDDIKAAVQDWQMLSADFKENLKAIPLIKLTLDFVIHPYELASPTIREHPIYRATYVMRAEKTYKGFRHAYLEVPSLSQAFKGNYARADKFTKILNAILRKIPREQVTINDMLMARGEYEGWVDKLAEITEKEDVYSNIETLKMIFNYLNNIYLHTLATDVFPRLNKQSNVQGLLDLLVEQLRIKYRIVFDGGKFVRLASPSSKSYETMAQVSSDDTPLRDAAPSDGTQLDLGVVVAPVPEVAGASDPTTKAEAEVEAQLKHLKAEAM